MSTENDLALAYHMGYDDALAKRKPDASKTQVLAPHDLAIENAKLRELLVWMYRLMDESCAIQYPYAPEPIRYDTLMCVYEKLRELGIEAD